MIKPTLLLLLGALVVSACEQHHNDDGVEHGFTSIEYLSPESYAAFPFSEAVAAGDLLFLSGKLGTTADGLVEGGIQAETRQTLQNISDALDTYGSSMDRVVKCTVMLATIDEWPAMNEVYKEFFPTNKPARSAFGGAELALDARVEIECIAMR